MAEKSFERFGSFNTGNLFHINVRTFYIVIHIQ